MKSWALRVEEQAERDVRDGFDYYEQEAGDVVAIRFAEAVVAAIDKVHEAPERWPVFNSAGDRHYVMRKFPYAVIYAIQGETVVVFAVGHTRRRPGYYRDS